MKKLSIAALTLIAIVSWSSALLISSKADTAPSQQSLVPRTFSLQTPKPLSQGWTTDTQYLDKKTNKPLPAVFSFKKTTAKVLGASTFNTDKLTSDQALALDKPGVISIINDLSGNLEIPDFNIDLNTLVLTPITDLSNHRTPVDDQLYGTGFIVNANGYAITNAHVIAKDAAYKDLNDDVTNHFDDVYQAELDQLGKKQYQQYQDSFNKIYPDTDAGNQKLSDAIDAAVAKYIKEQAIDHVTQKIVVVDKSLDPTSLPQGQEVQTAFDKGLPITVVDFDTNYQKSGLDVALVKLNQQDIPALPLGNTQNITSGMKVTVLGYPYNAQIDDSDLFQPTLTQGIISSVKQYNNQKVFQLDNKTSEGSSGSPVIDEHGQVVGIITYINGDPSSGDQFTYALPIDLAKNILSKNQVNNDLGVYGTNFLLGISFADINSCKKAINDFQAAEKANPIFKPQDYLHDYIQTCQETIAAGKSNDNLWDAIKIFYTQNTSNALIFSVILLLALFFGGWMISHVLITMKKNRLLIPTPPHP